MRVCSSRFSHFCILPCTLLNLCSCFLTCSAHLSFKCLSLTLCQGWSCSAVVCGFFPPPHTSSCVLLSAFMFIHLQYQDHPKVWICSVRSWFPATFWGYSLYCILGLFGGFLFILALAINIRGGGQIQHLILLTRVKYSSGNNAIASPSVSGLSVIQCNRMPFFVVKASILDSFYSLILIC